jgi:hypothetical protein
MREKDLIFVLEFLVFPIDFTFVGQDFLVLRKGPEKKTINLLWFPKQEYGKAESRCKILPHLNYLRTMVAGAKRILMDRG